MKTTVALLSVLFVLVSGCAKSSTPASNESSPPKASASMHHPKDVKCSPTDKATIQAKDVAFSTDCLAFEADKPFSIQFKNEDVAVMHNIAIFKDPNAAEKIFTGELTTGPAEVTYNVDPIAKGNYHFHCDVHPDMNGTVVIG